MPTEMRADAYQSTATEAEMESAVLDLVKFRGGRLFHVRRTDAAPELVDLPDWLILAPPLVLLIEAKSQRRQVTPGQRAVLDLAAGCDLFLSGICRPVPKSGEFSLDSLLALIEDTA